MSVGLRERIIITTRYVLHNTGGYRNYVPDWEPYRWHPSQGNEDFYRNRTLPQTMFEAFPPANGPTATEQGVVEGTEEKLAAAAVRVSDHDRRP